MNNITEFRIAKLHGTRDIAVEIRDDCVILVGVNGLGKTTIINILFYFLTRQWSKLAEYRFESLTLVTHNDSIPLKHSQLESHALDPRIRRQLVELSPRLRRRLERDPSFWDVVASARHNPSILERLSTEYNIPPYIAMDLFSWSLEQPIQPQLFDSDYGLEDLEECLRNICPGQVLYLPTYRRIEHDLEKIFPGLEDRIHRHGYAKPDRRDGAYIEFVEFGMRDVEVRFSELLSNLKERSRTELNKLAASYLGEVIRGEADIYDMTVISRLDDSTIERILNRVEERDLLNSSDRGRLREAISRLRTIETQASPQDTYIGHFFSKLASIHRSLAKAEQEVEAFVQVCNNYLTGKSIVFDDRKYAISITQEEDGSPLELQHLSSGEKQIVSLFTHVYLGESSDLIVLIDEPELSLSVPWQRKLLPDIRDSGRCRFLAAVTHSPFIYGNELRQYATDLQQCISSPSLPVGREGDSSAHP